MLTVMPSQALEELVSPNTNDRHFGLHYRLLGDPDDSQQPLRVLSFDCCDSKLKMGIACDRPEEQTYIDKRTAGTRGDHAGLRREPIETQNESSFAIEQCGCTRLGLIRAPQGGQLVPDINQATHHGLAGHGHFEGSRISEDGSGIYLASACMHCCTCETGEMSCCQVGV